MRYMVFIVSHEINALAPGNRISWELIEPALHYRDYVKTLLELSWDTGTFEHLLHF